MLITNLCLIFLKFSFCKWSMKIKKNLRLRSWGRKPNVFIYEGVSLSHCCTVRSSCVFPGMYFQEDTVVLSWTQVQVSTLTSKSENNLNVWTRCIRTNGKKQTWLMTHKLNFANNRRWKRVGWKSDLHLPNNVLEFPTVFLLKTVSKSPIDIQLLTNLWNLSC